MVAAGHVNWAFILVLVGPSLLVLAIVALTWRSRARQIRDGTAKRSPQSGAEPPPQSGAKRPPQSGAKRPPQSSAKRPPRK
jgi:hypothetical protein